MTIADDAAAGSSSFVPAPGAARGTDEAFVSSAFARIAAIFSARFLTREPPFALSVASLLSQTGAHRDPFISSSTLQQIRRKLGVHRSLEALWSKPIQRAMIA
jgi:hypothetical protein